MAMTDGGRTDRVETTPSYPAPSGSSVGRGYSIAAFVCAVAGFLILPIVFGPLGIALGYVAHRKGDPLGKWAAVTAGVLGVAGMILGAILIANA